jgi:glucokinase
MESTGMAQKKETYWAGFDLGGTKMRVAIFDKEFRLISSAEGKTKGFRGVRNGVQRMAELLDDAWRIAREKENTPRAKLSGVGLACPGPVNAVTGTVRELVNLGWHNVPLAQMFSRTAGGVPVVTINDVDAGTFGEYRFGAGRGGRCVVGIFPGTGVGGGCVLHGQLLTGAEWSAMEIGHLPVMPRGPLCGCGQRGCLEALSSRIAISQSAAAAAFRGQAPHLMAEVGTDLQNIRSRALAKAIAAGDEAIEVIVRDAARWIGVGVAIMTNLLAPDIVVLGGGLVEAMPQIYKEEVESMARKRTMRTYQKSFRITVAKLGDNAAIMGAAAWAEQAFGQARK